MRRPLNVAWDSGVPPYTDRPPSANSPWELKGNITLSQSYIWKVSNWWIESEHPVRCPSASSKYWSNSTGLQLPISLDHGLQVCLQTRSITASKLAQSRRLSVSASWLNYSLQSRSITASMCISKLAGLLPASSHNYGLQVDISKLAQLWPPTECPKYRSIMASSCSSPNTLDYNVGVHLYVHSITSYTCISKSPSLPPPHASPKSIDHGLGVYLCAESIIIVSRTSKCSQALPGADPDIPCVDWQLSRYIDENPNWIHKF